MKNVVCSEEARNSEEGDGSEEVGNHIDVISYAMYITY